MSNNHGHIEKMRAIRGCLSYLRDDCEKIDQTELVHFIDIAVQIADEVIAADEAAHPNGQATIIHLSAADAKGAKSHFR